MGVTNITLMLRFMKSDKFYYVQNAKVVNLKVLVVKESNFVHGDKFSSIFQILNFYLFPINEVRIPTGNVFNSFGFIDFALALFPLCLFWTYIFLVKSWY